MKFQNAAAAGAELAKRLNEFKAASNTIVIAIVSGGVFVAAEVARQLELPFELLFISRLWAPFGPERVLCATNVSGRLVLDDEIHQKPAANGLDHAIAEGIKQLGARERVCRSGRTPVDLSGRQVILVDNGIHTGSTVLAGIRTLRKVGVRKVVVAVPVADPNSRNMIERAADEIVCLQWPEKFGHAGLWYEEFVRPTDDQISTLYTCASGDDE
jgi:putative phosphoribosyl transferase